MNKIEKKLGKESFIVKKWEWGEHFKTKIAHPQLGGK
jgi:hypothetical protein